MKKLKVITLGCSKNSVDSEHLLSSLPEGAFDLLPAESLERADIVLLNTCGFIGDAKEESIQAILEAVELKNRGEAGAVVVMGCLSQRYEKELMEEIPEVDAWFGARDLSEVLSYLCPGVVMPVHHNRFRVQEKPYAYLKISEGCDRRCSYCAIPHIRGPHRSVPVDELVREASRLASSGVKELVIIAQDITFYGLDLYGKRSLALLLRKLSDVEGIEWIRLHYSYPSDFPDDVLDEMAVNRKICRYMDIPLQHISDRVLANMHRNVSSAATRSLVRKFREKVPGIVLRTTMIVGHPGEGREEFEELLSFMREARFERLGAFTYSEEEGTWGAEHLKDDVPQEIKGRRLDELMTEQRDISLEFNRSRVGSRTTVLVDDCVDGTLVCRSEYESPDVDGEILVKLPEGASPGEFVGKFAQVRIMGADEYDLIAELI